MNDFFCATAFDTKKTIKNWWATTFYKKKRKKLVERRCRSIKGEQIFLSDGVGRFKTYDFFWATTLATLLVPFYNWYLFAPTACLWVSVFFCFSIFDVYLMSEPNFNCLKEKIPAVMPSSSGKDNDKIQSGDFLLNDENQLITMLLLQ